MLKKTLIFVAAVIIFAIAAAACFVIYYFEASDVGYKSLVTYISVPESIRQTPLVDVCEIPKFNWRGRDGESPQHISLVYGTLQSPIELAESYANFFRKENCQSNPAEILADGVSVVFNCEHDDFRSIVLSIEKQSSCRRVEVTFLEN